MPREGKVTSVCACSSAVCYSAVCSSAVVLLCCAGGKMQTKTPSRRSHSSRVTYHQVCLPCNWPLVSVAHLLCCSAAGARHMLSTCCCCCCCCCCSVLMLLMLLCCFRERSKKFGNVYPFDKPLKDPPPPPCETDTLDHLFGTLPSSSALLAAAKQSAALQVPRYLLTLPNPHFLIVPQGALGGLAF